MSIIRKLFLHLIIVIITSLFFLIIQNIGIYLLYHSSFVNIEDRWKFNTSCLHLYTDVAAPYTVAGYGVFLLANFLLSKNKIKVSSGIVGILSFVATAFILTSLGFGLNLKDPLTINFIIAVALSGYFSPFLNKKLLAFKRKDYAA
jgi:hypothetical protein